MKAPIALNESDQNLLDRFERFSLLLDRRYLDPFLGLVFPGAGDVLGAILGLYGVRVALRLRAHPIILARMLLNLALDALIGAIPLAGAVGDFFFRANLRNVALLRERQARPVHPIDYVIVGGAAFAFLMALILPILLVAWLFSALSRFFS